AQSPLRSRSMSIPLAATTSPRPSSSPAMVPFYTAGRLRRRAPMPIHRLNHAVLYVRDAVRTAAFYEEALGFRRLGMAEGMRGAVFLQAPGSTNDHDLGVFSV